MASSYQSKFPPNTPVDRGIAEYFEIFYNTSDTPDAHKEYAELFTKSATMIMASKISEGYDGKFVDRFLQVFALSLYSGNLRRHFFHFNSNAVR